MKKEKRCKYYCGITCVNGNCPIALYNEDSTLFEKKPTCNNCYYYKGCEDCYFSDTEDCYINDKKKRSSNG